MAGKGDERKNDPSKYQTKRAEKRTLALHFVRPFVFFSVSLDRTGLEQRTGQRERPDADVRHFRTCSSLLPLPPLAGRGGSIVVEMFVDSESGSPVL